MKPMAGCERSSLVTTLVLAGAIGIAGPAFAQNPQGQAGTNDKFAASTKELMSEKPIIPSKAEMPDAAFKKLDAAGKGFVSKQDTRDLNGFDNSFQFADENHDGKLDASEFRKAWANYTGRKSG